MLGRKTKKIEDQPKPLRGFDDYDVNLGDILRGERATLGKSLMDVQKELRIRACYIAAIENCDPDAFDTPGFIAGYVRSYARYLNLDPDELFAAFCAESGFKVSHGMSAQASGARRKAKTSSIGYTGDKNIFEAPATPFIPQNESIFSSVEPGALGSSAILLALIGAIGFGSYTVFREIQRVQVAPVEHAPAVLSELDPLDAALGSATDEPPSTPAREALDRLYRPQALDVPVLVSRDGPIAAIDPEEVGAFVSPKLEAPEDVDIATLDETPQATALAPSIPQVVGPDKQKLTMIAVQESWVRVRAADGSVIYEGVMQPGETWDAPLTETPPILRTGNAGGVYFAMAGKFFGPVGAAGEVRSNVDLSIAGLQERLLPVDANQDDVLIRYAQLQAAVEAASR